MTNSQFDQVCLVQENAGVLMQNILKPSETKKVSITHCFYIRKHLKYSISTLNNVHLSPDSMVFCYWKRVPVFI